MTNYTKAQLLAKTVVQLREIKKKYKGHSSAKNKADIVNFILENQSSNKCDDGKIINNDTNRCIKTDGKTATDKYAELRDGCPAGKIRNPDTGRCVNMDGPAGKKIIEKWERKQKKKCKKGTILNKSTNRCVKRTGQVAKTIKKLRDDCPKGKLKNPDSGRCVKADGTIGKNVYKKSRKTPKKLPFIPIDELTSPQPIDELIPPQPIDELIPPQPIDELIPQTFQEYQQQISNFDGSLKGRVFVFDGFIDSELSSKIERGEGEMHDVVSFDTSYLVVEDGDIDENSYNVKQAKNFNKTIITKSDLENRLSGIVDSCLVPGMKESLCLTYKTPDIIDLARRIGIPSEVIRRNTKEQLCKIISQKSKREIPIFAPHTESISKDGTCNIYGKQCPPTQACEILNDLGEGKCITKDELRSKPNLFGGSTPDGMQIVGDKDTMDKINIYFDNKVKMSALSDSSSSVMPELEPVSDLDSEGSALEENVDQVEQTDGVTVDQAEEVFRSNLPQLLLTPSGTITPDAQEALDLANAAQNDLKILKRKDISDEALNGYSKKEMINLLKIATNAPEDKTPIMPKNKKDIKKYFSGAECDLQNGCTIDGDVCDTRFMNKDDPDTKGICVPGNIIPENVERGVIDGNKFAGYSDFFDQEDVVQDVKYSVQEDLGEDPTEQDIDVEPLSSQEDLGEDPTEQNIENVLDETLSDSRRKEIDKIISEETQSENASDIEKQKVRSTVSMFLGLNF